MTGPAAGHGLVGRADAAAFLGRLTRLDPAAVVRLRSVGAGSTVLWARLPWEALVTRAVVGPGPGDVTVAAADLLTEVAGGGTRLPPRRDEQWRWALPPSDGQVVVETVAAAEIRRLAAAAADTLRAAAEGGVGGRRVGARALRDALLDHVALVVVDPAPIGHPVTARTEPDTTPSVEISQRLIQAVTRMGFLGSEGSTMPPVRVRLARRWVGLSAPYGIAWLSKSSKLTVRPIVVQTIG